MPECKLGIDGPSKVIANYQKLTADEKGRIPDAYYESALALVKGTPERKLVDDVKKAERPKNCRGDPLIF